jgi:RNA polymerase-binding protein DksA
MDSTGIGEAIVAKRHNGSNGHSSSKNGHTNAAAGRGPFGVNGNHALRSGRRANPALEPLSEPLPATKLTKEELDYYRTLLLRKRQELCGDVGHMEHEALGNNRMDATGDLSMMPIHMADIGTDNYEREFTLGLVENERETLREIDEALERIKQGTYGICLGTHKPIPKARLNAKPWARYCVTYKRLLEENGRR